MGVAIGVLVGGTAITAALGFSLTQSLGGTAVQPSASPIAATAAPSAVVVAPPVAPPGAPPAAISALSGTAVVNGRIAVDASTLDGTLARRDATTIEIARALRSLAADAALGVDLTGRLRPWTAAAPTMTKLNDFYHSMATTAHLALRAPLSDGRSYRQAAAKMMTVLGSLGDVDASSRTLAATVGLELPPVTLSGSTNAASSAAPAAP